MLFPPSFLQREIIYSSVGLFLPALIFSHDYCNPLFTLAFLFARSSSSIPVAGWRRRRLLLLSRRFLSPSGWKPSPEKPPSGGRSAWEGHDEPSQPPPGRAQAERHRPALSASPRLWEWGGGPAPPATPLLLVAAFRRAAGAAAQHPAEPKELRCSCCARTAWPGRFCPCGGGGGALHDPVPSFARAHAAALLPSPELPVSSCLASSACLPAFFRIQRNLILRPPPPPPPFVLLGGEGAGGGSAHPRP